MKGISNIPMMTKEHSDEINMLLKDHSPALTAFYDEGICCGWRARRVYDIGYILGIGTTVAVVITGSTMLIRKMKKKNKIKNTKKTEL